MHICTLSAPSTAPPLAALIGPAEAFRDEVVAAFQIFREVEEFGVVAELLEHVDGFERLGLFAAQESFDLWGDDEEAVELELEVGEVAEDNVLVLDRYYSFVSTSFKLFQALGSRYFDNKSFVRRMMNFITSPPSSLSFASLAALTASLAVESRPRMIACSKFFLKSFLLPRKLGFAKLRREKYSDRSF